jgi:hypothetical protein
MLDDIFSASAHGVLRAIEARQSGAEKLSVQDLVRSGFGVQIHIVAGGIIGPWLADRLRGAEGGPTTLTGGPSGR